MVRRHSALLRNLSVGGGAPLWRAATARSYVTRASGTARRYEALPRNLSVGDGAPL